MTLYLKYRPKNLDELDLTDVGESLKKILSGKDIPHAFLFAGPKGTGKTSAARILAKIINCVGKNPPCDTCEECISITNGSNLDVIEMDAASHRGIDDVRTLRDAVKLAPVNSKKKIYIIDEAHMLTTEASNALLKTLEEPPAHVIFILATTNPEKLIDTIKSRVTFIPFRKATNLEIVRSLKRVITGEKIKMDDEALSLIASAADGAFRDAIKILEQLVVEEKELTKEFLEEHLFSKKSFDLDNFISLLISKDVKSLLLEVGNLNERGVTVENFLDALLNKLRVVLLSKVGVGEGDIKEINKSELIRLIELLSQASQDIVDSPIEELPLEIAVIKWCDNGVETESTEKIQKNSDEDKDDKKELTGEKQEVESPNLEINTPTQSTNIEALTSSINDDIWKNILSLVKPINASIEALLRSSRPVGYDGKTLTLGVFYKFHKERLEDARHRKIIEEIIAQVLNSPTRVICIMVEPPLKEIIQEAKVEPILTEDKDKDIIKAAEEIFSN